MNNTDKPIVNIPLGSQAHQFATKQASAHKNKWVYLNALAVYAVHRYLKRLQVKIDLSQGDSWNPNVRISWDVANLIIPNIGKLECCPVLPGDTAFTLSPEVTKERIGYVAVQFNECLNQAQLLGFYPADDAKNLPEQIKVKDLMPRDDFIDYITEQEAAATVQTEREKLFSLPTLVKLRQWFEGIIESDWQPPELVLPALRTAAQASVSRAKVIDWGIQKPGQAVALVMQLTPTTTEKVDIHLRLYPVGDSIYLPPDLQVVVLDESGTVCMKDQARSADYWLQLDFDAEPEERFSVRVASGDVSITEQFLV